jgi:hypothetical protein
MCYAKFVANGLLQKKMQIKTEARMYVPSQQKRNLKISKEYSYKCGKIQIIGKDSWSQTFIHKEIKTLAQPVG